MIPEKNFDFQSLPKQLVAGADNCSVHGSPKYGLMLLVLTYLSLKGTNVTDPWKGEKTHKNPQKVENVK